MPSRLRFDRIVLLGALLGLLCMAAPGSAGLKDAIKKKAADKAKQAVEEGRDASEAGAAEAEEGADRAGGSGSGGRGSEAVSQVSTKFDFVPGDSVLFYDDLTQDELGEFPLRWRLTGGTFEVAEMKGERWLRCTSVDGTVRMKVPDLATLPEFWTLEFDFYATEPMGSALTVTAFNAGGGKLWEANFPQGSALAFRSGEIFSSTPYEGTVPGRHRVMFMARGTALKAYIDRQRMASVPEVFGGPGAATDLEIRLWSSSKPMITNVRLAEGGRPAKDLLAEGRLVTHGIHFATGSDVVLPESAPILRQVAAYLESNPKIALLITGHTDNVGNAASNLDLSKRRSASVARVLAQEFSVAADRLATDGVGDTQPMSSNAKAEGRAMNRRVEFAKR